MCVGVPGGESTEERADPRSQGDVLDMAGRPSPGLQGRCLPPTRCAALSKSLNLFVPQFMLL